jgi:integrase
MACVRRRQDKWQCQVRRKGFKARSNSFAQRKDAERWGMLQERELDLLESRGLTEPATPCTMILADAFERHAQLVRAGSGEQYLLRAMKRRSIASKTLTTLSRQDVIAYRDARLSKVGASTVAREIWLIQRTLDLARKEWGFPSLDNVAREVAKPRLPRGRERRLVAGEETKLLMAAKATRTPGLSEIIRFGLETAMRQGEMLGLRWEHIDLEGRTALLPRTKNGRARTVPLSLEAIRILEASSNNASGPFPASKEAVKQAWKRITEKSGSPDLHFHDLRHEAVSRLFELGLEMPEVMMISGHTDPRMLLRYTHLNARKLVEKLDAA